jgi:putative addiction module antidote
MITLKLTAIGHSVGVILPKEALAALKLQKGDTVYLTESPEGYRLTPYYPRETIRICSRALVILLETVHERLLAILLAPAVEGAFESL